MSTFRMQLLAALTVGAGMACGGGSGPSAEALTGRWNATKAEFVLKADPSTKVDVVATGGAVSLLLNQDKSFTLTVTAPQESPEVMTGTWSSSADVLTLTFQTGLNGNMQFDMSLSGNTLSLIGADAPFDVDDDGVEEETKLNVSMIRQP